MMAAEAGAAPARVRRGRGWLLAMLVSSVALCSAITLAHLVHQRRLAEITAQLLALKQASADLDEAFLHLQLGGDAQSPWQRSQGLALLAQADAELRELGRAAEQQAAVAEIGNAIAALRERWPGASGAAGSSQAAGGALAGDRAGELQARLALHALRQRLAELDDAMATRSEQASRRLDGMFNATLALAALLLAGVGWGMVRSERERTAAQRSLLRSERQQRSTLAALSEGVVLLDADGHLASANPAAAQLLGDDLPARLPALLGALEPADGAHAATACRLEVPGRGARVISLRRDALPEGDGAVLSFADVTDERAAVEQLAAHRERLEELVQARTQALEQALAAQREVENFAQTVTDAQPTLLAFWDRELRLRFVNKAYLDWFGFRRDEVLGRPMSEVLGQEEIQRQQRNIDRVLAGEAFEAAQELHAPGGSGRFWVYRLPMRREERVEGYVFVATNITALRHAEERLATMNEELARRAELAEQATRAKSAFLANMSHEIRTPMNAITGLTHLLLREVHEPVHRERLGKIDVAARHLLKVINDILDLSKIEAGRLELSERDFSCEELVGQALAMVADEARARGLTLTADAVAAPARLRGDPQRLSQALLNLLSNALKFTSSGWVRVRARAEPPEADGRVPLRIEVHDSGIGVPPERLEALFTPFEQADNSITRRFGGTGLGLALTRHLATLMGGEAGASSEPGRGSLFWFSARVKPALGSAGSGNGAGARAPSEEPLLPADAALVLLRRRHAGLRVLLAEDNPVNQDVASALLRDAELEVDVATDGTQAVAMACEVPYALLLMDVQMPGLDGLQVTRELRRLGHDEPVLAMTANAFDEDRQACLAAGMNDHLGKPVQPERLYAALLRWLPPVPPARPLAERGPSPALPAPAAPAALETRLAAVAGLDATQALRNVAGNSRALERVLRAFVTSYARGVPALLQPVSADALPDLRAACHALRGACAAVGAVALSRQLLTLEQRLTSADDLALPNLALDAHLALEALVVSLARALDA